MSVLVSHWQPPPPWTDDKPACFTRAGDVPAADLLTGMRELVTCPDCKQTPTWKAGILAIRVVADPPRKASP